MLAELNKFAMEVKGLEFSMYVTKESLAQQGGYGFALKGPQHDEAWLIFIDQVHKEIAHFRAKSQCLEMVPSDPHLVQCHRTMQTALDRCPQSGGRRHS